MARRGGNVNVQITSDFDARGTRHAERALDRLNSTGRRVGAGLGTLARGAGVAGAALGAGLAFEAKKAYEAFDESRKIAAQTNAVIKSTGGVANVTAREVASLADSLSKKTGVDDEAIQTGSNLLLTFKRVHNEAGRGNDIFNRATAAAVDLAAAGFGSIDSASKQIGKALNDPIKGMTALSRSGVTFTEQQKQQITTLVESNRTLEAQRIILREVESQVSGSAAAQGTNLDRLRVAVGNLQEAIGGGLAPVVDTVSGKLAKMLEGVEPRFEQVSREIDNIFERRDIDLGEKLKMSSASVRTNLRPVVRQIEAEVRSARIGERLSEALEAGVPKVMEAAGRGGTKAVGAFLKGWWEADGWGKLATAAFIIAKLGGFSAAGGWAARTFAARFRKMLGRTGMFKTAGTAAAGTTATAMADGMPDAMSKRRGKLANAGRLVGRTIGVAAGVAAVAEISSALGKLADEEGVGGRGGAGIGGPNSWTRGGIGVGRKIARALGLGGGGSGSSGSLWGGLLSSAAGIAGSTGRATGTRTGPGMSNAPGASTSVGGRVVVRSGANRQGVGLNSGIASLTRAAAGEYGGTLNVGTGTAHSKMTASGNVSDHWGGDAVDIPATGNDLIRMGQAALVAAGADRAWARKQRGGLYNIRTPGGGRAQIIFNTQEGGDHTDHLHIGLKGKLGNIAGSTAINRLATRARLSPQQRTVQRAARKYGIDPAILWGLYGAESNFGRNQGPSSAGALGPFQFMPGTARSLGIDPMNFEEAAFGAAKYLSQFKSRGTRGMLAAYNAGPAGNPNNPETRAYIPKVLKLARRFPDLSAPDAGGIGASLEVEPTDWDEIARRQAEAIILPIARKLRKRLVSAISRIGRSDRLLGRLEQRTTLRERYAGIEDEDLNDPAQRAVRLKELRGLRNLTLNRGFVQKQRLEALKAAADQYIKAIRELRRAMRRAHGAGRGTIRGRIRRYQERVREIRAEARELGFEWKMTGADYAELQHEIDEVRDAPYEPNMDNVDAARNAIGAPLGAPPGETGAESADTAATDSNTAALEETTRQLQALNERLEEQAALTRQQLAEVQRTVNVSQMETRVIGRALADLVSGQLGGRVGAARMTVAAPGVLARA